MTMEEYIKIINREELRKMVDEHPKDMFIVFPTQWVTEREILNFLKEKEFPLAGYIVKRAT